MPETKRPHSLSFTPTVWAALEAEAALQGRSINNLLEQLAKAYIGRSLEQATWFNARPIAATSTPGETKS